MPEANVVQNSVPDNKNPKLITDINPDNVSGDRPHF